ncbi:MAG: DMT family transporter [Marinilabiliaceae bacterium]
MEEQDIERRVLIKRERDGHVRPAEREKRGMGAKDDAYLRLHLGILLAGGTGIFGRLISLTEVPLVWYRMLTAFIVMGVIMAVRRKLHLPARRDLLRICGCGAILAAHWVFFYGSIKASNVSIAVVCIALEGFFTAVAAPVITRSRFSAREFLFSLIALAGIVMIFGFDMRHRLGIALGATCAFLYALFSIFSKGVQQKTGESSSTMLLYELAGGWLLLSLAMPLYAMANPEVSLTPSSATDWGLLLVFGSLFTVGPFLLQLQALRRLSAFTVNLSFNLEPVYSIVFAAFIFDEANEVNRFFWGGVGLIIVSVALQTIYSRRRGLGRRETTLGEENEHF